MSVVAASRWFAAILPLLVSAVAHADGRQTLKEKQLRWLKKRDEATDNDLRDVVTAERIAYLRAWAER